jgi:preprotein translocase subunit SecF
MKFFELIPPNLNLDWLKMGKPLVFLSWAAILGSVVGLYYPGLNYGIDFTGGAEVHVKVPSAWDTAHVRDALSQGKVEATVVSLGQPGDGEFLVKVQAKPEELKEVSDRVQKSLSLKADGAGIEIKRTDVVGPKAGESLRKGALLSIIYCLLVISVYIAFRFDMRYAPAVTAPNPSTESK